MKTSARRWGHNPEEDMPEKYLKVTLGIVYLPLAVLPSIPGVLKCLKKNKDGLAFSLAIHLYTRNVPIHL